jgi:hypothetical protein
MTEVEGYAEQKLRSAVEPLATSAASIQERLLNAALMILALSPSDFEEPGDQRDFSALRDMLRLAPDDADQATLRATIAAMSDEQAVAAASSIFTLYARLAVRR